MAANREVGMQKFAAIVFEKEADGVATIMLNRPERLNSFNQKILVDMQAVRAIVRDDDEIKATALRAAPRGGPSARVSM